MKNLRRSKRFEALEKRAINLDGFSEEWPDVGLVAMDSPHDPTPSIQIKNGNIVGMDGKVRDDFDQIDQFIADYGIDLKHAEESMQINSATIARMLVDINVPRDEIVKIATSITPAKIVEVMNHLNVLEIMMGQAKMRTRKTPSNQAHVTNIRDNPVLMAADAAEAALRGFAELETTTAVARYAAFNAIALLIGSQTGRGGVLTQCSMEEATELKLGLKGFTSYAETVSVYGTDAVMTDGDDTPWSKAFLASGYASRGIKMRFTSGTGSEVLMGDAEKKSMLYLEARCLYLTRACGVQGIQNGAISTIGITAAVPSGFRAIAAENLIASMLNLEVVSGNDQTFSHSDMRRTAKFLMQLIPGTDFITSGFGSIPNFDNVFAGSNTDCDDYDDWYVIQRDMKLDGGLIPITESEAINVRYRATKACQTVFRELGLPEITDEEVEEATYAYSAKDMPERNTVEDMAAASELLNGNITGLDIVKILHQNGFEDIAANILNMLEQRVTGDYLQTSAIIGEDFSVISAINDANNYSGPGTGYIIDDERWDILKKKENAITPDDFSKSEGKPDETKVY